jgi:Gpi18-like mannosyltransferase
VDQGIHQAYSWGYDWLPLYLYLSLFVGLLHRHSGLADHFGSHGEALTLLLKLPMMLLNLLVGWLIYRLVRRLGGTERQALAAGAVYLFNPAILLATTILGYQDALHTALVILAVYCLSAGRERWAPVWTTLAFLTKPQAALFWIPIGALFAIRTGIRGLAGGMAAAVGTAGLVLLPFILHGELASVGQMYWNVPRVHEWLTGCAHNIWWVFFPAPPFQSDRDPLLLGLNGLTLGLAMFALFASGSLLRLLRQPSEGTLVHVCAFLAFAFFMVVTQIHENHLYAMFPFLAVLMPFWRPFRLLYAGLTLTFAVNMALVLRLLQVDGPVMVGPIRLALVNALANVGMLGLWSVLLFRSRREWDFPSALSGQKSAAPSPTSAPAAAPAPPRAPSGGSRRSRNPRPA